MTTQLKRPNIPTRARKCVRAARPAQHTHDPRAYTDSTDRLTVPTPQRNQVCLDLLHQGRQPGICGCVELSLRDVGQELLEVFVEQEGNVLRQHVGCDGRRRELALRLPYD